VSSESADELYFIEQRIAIAKKEIQAITEKMEEEKRVEFSRKDRYRRRGR